MPQNKLTVQQINTKIKVKRKEILAEGTNYREDDSNCKQVG